MIAGERDGWDYVWPRDGAAGAIALEACGLSPEARRVAGFLGGLDLDAARFHPDGDRVPGRPVAGDAAGWVRRRDWPPAGSGRMARRPRTGAAARTTARTSPGTCSATRSRAVRPRPRSWRASARHEGWCGNPGARSSTPRPPGLPPSSPAGVCAEQSRRTLLELARRVHPLRDPADRGMDAGPGLDRADGLVGVGADRARREARRRPPPARAPPRGHAARDAPRAGRCAHRASHLDHAPRLVPRLRDPRPSRPLPEVDRPGSLRCRVDGR